MTSYLIKAAVTGILLSLAVSMAFAQNSASYATARHATSLHAGDIVTGSLELSQPIHIVIALKLRNKGQLAAFLVKAQQPGSQRTMDTTQLVAQFSPTMEQAQTVANFLKKFGFTNVTISVSRLLVSGDGTAGVAQEAFRTNLVRVFTYDGREAFADSSDVHIPSTLQSIILSVLGLQTVHVSHTFVQHVSLGSTNQGQSFFDPINFPSIYGGSGVPTASSIPVGIITEGSMTNVINDLKSFTSFNSLPTVTTQTLGTSTTDTSNDQEWDEDSQAIVGMSGGVQKIVFFVAKTLYDADLITDFDLAESYSNSVKIINVSLGQCEINAQQAGMAAASDQAFMMAMANGQTFSVAAGDLGSYECGGNTVAQSWPASSQYVVAVGGTTLNASATTWYGETAWPHTGGGPSTFEPMPSWQQGVGQNAGYNTRGVPDVAFDGDPNTGALIWVHGQYGNEEYGGTSLSAPLFAGSWARMLAAKGSGIGAAPLLLYNLPASDFHDIVQGSNGAETAAVGWDYVSGFGSTIMYKEVQNIVATPTASNGSVTTTTNTPVGGTLSASDVDDETLTFAIVTQPAHGTVTITNVATGAFTYTPASGFSGSDSFTFKVYDNFGDVSNTATESVTIVAYSTAQLMSIINLLIL